MYPQVEPYDQGMLDVGDGQLIHWEVSGNPDGKPACVFHGGPGSGSNPRWREDFDPDHWKLVLWDQRGAGRSTPPVSDPATSTEHNTTQHLIDDAEKLREHLGIDKWLLIGGSWGSTLILAYAIQHPDRVSEIIIPAVTTSRPEEHAWITRGLGLFYPDYFDAFRDGVPEEDRDGNLALAYNKLLNSPDPAVREKAAWDWSKWDLSTITGGDNNFEGTRYEDPVMRYQLARTVTHYWGNEAFLEPNYIFDNLDKLKGIPAVLIHGRNDFGGPLYTAWEVAKRWPDAELVILNDAGHVIMEGNSLDKAISAAVEKFR
ncbi:prolyl aminopeptidase [Lentzea aerocolonigenes]|uniref:prolyl aminopeptidase n=1 Tax=Lentzea aerocolonigenes TaxID=68170 RepID=UPI0004C45EE9|nr:prolyl aminopeptidase [Lentzea aerocolonigenes]MCP2243720.1 proline iminopeptidase [Lentzea aerocolonigenes]